MKRSSYFAVIILVAAMSGAVYADSKSGGVAEAKEGIEQANAKFVKAVEHNDGAAVAALYTEDAIILPPDGDILKGGKGIADYWKAAVGGDATNKVVLTTVDVGRSDGIAYETGKYSWTNQQKGKPATTEAGKYVVVWKRQADGSWKLHRDVWNGTPPAK